MEQITYSHPNANLVRINPQYPQIPQEIEEKSIPLQNGAQVVINALWESIQVE